MLTASGTRWKRSPVAEGGDGGAVIGRWASCWGNSPNPYLFFATEEGEQQVERPKSTLKCTFPRAWLAPTIRASMHAVMAEERGAASTLKGRLADVYVPA